MLGHSSPFVNEVPAEELALLSVASQQSTGSSRALQNAHVKQGAKVKNVCVLKTKCCVTPVVILA